MRIRSSCNATVICVRLKLGGSYHTCMSPSATPRKTRHDTVFVSATSAPISVLAGDTIVARLVKKTRRLALGQQVTGCCRHFDGAGEMCNWVGHTCRTQVVAMWPYYRRPTQHHCEHPEGAKYNRYASWAHADGPDAHAASIMDSPYSNRPPGNLKTFEYLCDCHLPTGE